MRTPFLGVQTRKGRARGAHAHWAQYRLQLQYCIAARADRLDGIWAESIDVTQTTEVRTRVIEQSTKKKAHFSPAIEGNGQDIGGIARVLSAVVCQWKQTCTSTTELRQDAVCLELEQEPEKSARRRVYHFSG